MDKNQDENHGPAELANVVLRYNIRNIHCKEKEAIISLCLTSAWLCWNSIASFGQNALKAEQDMQNNVGNTEEST